MRPPRADRQAVPAIARAATRTWTDASGSFKVEATLVGVEDGKVQLRKTDGTTIAVPIDKLSAADQAIVRRQFP